MQTATAKPPRLSKSVKAKILERVQDGCYTAETVLACPECGNRLFDLEEPEVVRYLEALVADGLAEFRFRPLSHGQAIRLCVPVD
jgi:hypothetical protein